jgi:hypothetical protein
MSDKFQADRGRRNMSPRWGLRWIWFWCYKDAAPTVLDRKLKHNWVKIIKADSLHNKLPIIRLTASSYQLRC